MARGAGGVSARVDQKIRRVPARHPEELAAHYAERKPKGEFVVLVHRA